MTTSASSAFDATTTADDVIAGIDLHGLRAVVTGGSSGLGAETARVLATAGCEVTLAVRNLTAGRDVAAQITAQAPDARVHVAELDLASLASARRFAAEWEDPLHLLINNAGVMALEELTRTADGHEMQFGTNHLGHFALSVGLHDALSRGAAEPTAQRVLGGSRLVSLSSRGHLVSGVDFEDVDFERRPYSPFLAYGQSKTANVLFAVEAAARWAKDGIIANAVHPGAIGETNLYRHMPAARNAASADSMNTSKSIAQGAATSVYAAVSPDVTVGGRYFEDCHEAVVLGPDTENLLAHENGVAWYALDPAGAARLWDLSERFIA